MRAFLLVIDSFGIGELPDASIYGDQGSNTALHIAQKIGVSDWSCLMSLGLGKASELLGNPFPIHDNIKIVGSFGVMKEKSPGKDTTTGHWELGGITLETPFPVFPGTFPSFPEALLQELTQLTGWEFIGNKAASGTEIIQELGDEHRRTKKLIAYTSADSVFQVACHEEVMSLKELYDFCAVARQVCNKWKVGRVIARPFKGESAHYERTAGRHDYSYPLPGPSVLDLLKDKGIKVLGVGKIGDIFNNQGLTESFPDKGNEACLNRVFLLEKETQGQSAFIFVNLVDTDMIWGHRRDTRGYHDCVAQIDKKLRQLIPLLQNDDILMISADHGCDPTYKGTDHTREHVPILIYQKNTELRNLGVRETFSDVAQTLAELFKVTSVSLGKSLL